MKFRFSLSGVSVRGPFGTRWYFKACQPCKTRRPCAHR